MGLVTDFKELEEKIQKFIAARDWEKFHTPKNLAMSISIEAAELMELFQWISINTSKERIMVDEQFRDEVRKELADILIYALSFASSTGIDLKQAILDKLAINEDRFPPDKGYSF